MEFPTDFYNIFNSDNFETAEPRSPGLRGVELMAQIRPNGRIVDHWRLALGGTEILEAKLDLAFVIPAAATLPKWKLSYLQWPRDVIIKRNMTTSAWMDLRALIETNEILVANEDGSPAATQAVVEGLNSLGDKTADSAAARWAVAISEAGKMELQLQFLPAPVNLLVGKPIFKR